jgi:H2-forming N5,N10-methylenetetrahydromethanopterin dehydrogenase-like enzyme
MHYEIRSITPNQSLSHLVENPGIEERTRVLDELIQVSKYSNLKELKEKYQQLESITMHYIKMKIESIVSKLKSRLNHLVILISLTLEKNTKHQTSHCHIWWRTRALRKGLGSWMS